MCYFANNVITTEAHLEEEGTMACQEMEARQEEEEPTSVDMKSEVAERREVPVEDATVMPVGEPKRKQRRDRKLAAECCCQKTKNSTREKCESQKRLVVARRGMSHRTIVARPKQKRNDTRMSRHATVAQLKREILRNTTQKKCGPHKRLGFASKGMTRRAKVAGQKENVTRRNCTRAMTEQATQRLGPLKKNLRTRLCVLGR
jgi:hypothetical protein